MGGPSEQKGHDPELLSQEVHTPGANRQLFGSKSVLGGEREQGGKFFPSFTTFIFTLVIPTTSTTPAKKQKIR